MDCVEKSTHSEDCGCVERTQEERKENQMSLRPPLVHVHQAQLGQLANHLFKVVSLRGAERGVRLHRRALSCTSLVGETDRQRPFLLASISFDSVRVTHYLQTQDLVEFITDNQW